MRKQKKAEKSKEIKRKPAAYMAELFVLTAVIAAALLIPQLIFHVQDSILYGRTELSRQDSSDIEFLGSSYEQSLHRRMVNFSEGLAAGDRFYVTVRNFTDNDELEEYLHSDSGLYQELFSVFVELDLLGMFWDYAASVNQWKQYVIYSDNYAKGVNFILWYIELIGEDYTVMKLLADGETGMIYAVKTEGNSALTLKDTDMGGLRDPRYWQLFEEGEICEELLAFLMMCYEAQNWEELFSLVHGIDYSAQGSRLSDMARIRELAKSGSYVREDRDFLFRLPYEGNYLDFSVEIGDINILNMEKLSSLGMDFALMYPDILLGIRQIYEMIPEFQ